MSKRWTPMRRLLAARQVDSLSDRIVNAMWRGYWICVERGGGDWYIRVRNPKGVYDYDGWWPGSEDKSAEEAVAEAFSGAMLLEDA